MLISAEPMRLTRKESTLVDAGLTAVSFKYNALLSDPGLRGFQQRGNDVELTLCDSALYTSKALPRILW
ncbi:hypothetical protein CYMTET_7344 [Cymbomonas tetramitiformis]|uniref:Uncharacterized protein n=1 Tax=Cymbomonas tetramitiformis TaxID=36881 RepID=A0AAE0LH60_9CHLO|nr:hypothetical protein CYMTET_7344 [Cymbomonas tetramitiformis]